MNMKAFLVCLLVFAIIERSDAAFQCYKCNDCGSTWNTNKAYMVFTEGGGNYCTKRVIGTTVIKDYSAGCPQGNGVSCCQDELCNSSNSKYHINSGIFILISIIGLVVQQM